MASFVVGVLTMRAAVFGVSIRAPDFWKLGYSVGLQEVSCNSNRPPMILAIVCTHVLDCCNLVMVRIKSGQEARCTRRKSNQRDSGHLLAKWRRE